MREGGREGERARERMTQKGKQASNVNTQQQQR